MGYSQHWEGEKKLELVFIIPNLCHYCLHLSYPIRWRHNFSYTQNLLSCPKVKQLKLYLVDSEKMEKEEWLSSVTPRTQPYFPQVGDEVVYFKLGMLYCCFINDNI